MTYSSKFSLGLLLGVVALLSACGGGSDTVAPQVVVDSDVPVTATQTAKEAISFVRTVADDATENGDGLRIDAADLATSETDEPEPDS
jgi:hypothetical protein